MSFAITSGSSRNKVAGLFAVGAAFAILWTILSHEASQTANLRIAGLFAIGLALGGVLYAASFGFTGSWRAFLSEGKGAGVRGQMLMLAIACLLFFPAMEAREIFGHRAGGFVAPVGFSVAIGAFLFGIGMQLGGACASGTLFSVGGGNTRMILTLIFFIVGSVLGTLHLDFFLSLPSLGRISVVRVFGAETAILIALAFFAAIALLSWWIEKRRYGRLVSHSRPGDAARPLLWRGAWPWIWGAVGLALLNFATLALSGQPWGVTSGFVTWGGQAADALGIPLQQSSDYWQRNAWRLNADLLRNKTSLMNIGIMIGALAAAGLAGTFSPGFKVALRPALAAIIGGVMLGYGARLAYGCNIGSFFSGTASGSLHGILWLFCALVGNALGIKLRPLFRL